MRKINATDQQHMQMQLMLDKVIKHCGSQSNLARLINVHRRNVVQWKIHGRVSISGATAIQKATDGEFKREDLRPDIHAMTWAAFDKKEILK